MKKQYVIEIVAKKAHQPSNDEIFKAIRELVRNRVDQFPTKNGSTSVSINPMPAEK